MRRNDDEGGHENNERWLLTYSDLITLLLALFIILYTMSSVDLDKFKELSKYLKVAFNKTSQTNTDDASLPESLGNLIFDPSNLDSSSTSQTGDGSETDNKSLDEIYNQINKFVTDNDLKDKIDLTRSSNELKITLRDTVLFYPNSPQMLANSEPIMAIIEKSINNVYQKVDHITISGHTADPNHNGNYSAQSDWDLSVNRAVTVLKYLTNAGMPSNKLSIEGYSHFKPIASDNNPTDSAKNRRVEITIRKEAK